MKNQILTAIIVILICAIIVTIGVFIANINKEKKESVNINDIGPIVLDQNGQRIPPEYFQGGTSNQSENSGISLPGLPNDNGMQLPPEATNSANVILENN